MLRFATEIPLLPTRTLEDLYAQCCTWLTGSPNHSVSQDEIPGFELGEEREVKRDGCTITVGATEDDKGAQILGFRYQFIEDGARTWRTEIIGNHDGSRLWCAIRVYCSTLAGEAWLPKTRKPYIVRQLIEEFGTDLDGELHVSSLPLKLEEEQLDLAERLVRGRATERLPVIYISQGYQRCSESSIAKLAIWMSGLAHVIVEPSRTFSIRLGQATQRRNAYNGAIGVYWPQGASTGQRFLPGSKSLLQDVSKLVQRTHAHRLLTRELSWPYLRESITRRKFESLRTEGSADLDDYIEMVELAEEEGRATKEQLEAAEQEIRRLQELVAQNDEQPGAGLLSPPDEGELYEGETASLVVEFLQSQRKNVGAGTRRAEVLKQVIEANKKQRACRTMAQKVKAALKGKVDTRALSRIGFETVRSAKHATVQYQGEPRFAFTLPKTASDHRSLKNLASDIINKLF